MSGIRPEPHPEPPPDFSEVVLPLISSSGPWYRIHRAIRDALFFGKSGDNRFDALAGDYGIVYLGDSPHCAFIETFGRSIGLCVVTSDALLKRRLTRVDSVRPLSLVDLSGSGLARIGADARLGAGNHDLAQRWALALWAHPDQPDGLCYRARHDPSRCCVAVFDRAASALRATPQGSLLDPSNASLLADILDSYSFSLIDLP